ncbi:MAG TPA: DUF998 domain-containing protein [Anaerolineales bacterium]
MSTRLSSNATNEVISTLTDRAQPAMLHTAARLALAASIATLVFLAVLHLLSPEFDPSRRMVSEYALGNYGWILSLMFLTWALSCVALFFAARPDVRTIGGRIGLGLLLLSALGMIMAAMFDVSHNLHGLAAMIGIPNFPIAAVLISVSLGRNSSLTSARPLLVGTAILTLVSLILMMVAIFTGFSQTFEALPGAWFGWANRFLIVAYTLWLMTAAERILSLRQPQSS